jgi:glutaredoxin
MLIKFYTTSGCHLCEQALEMLQQLSGDFTIKEIEIADDDFLLEKYGITIPVVGIARIDRIPEGDEKEPQISWPFSMPELHGFIARYSRPPVK